MSPRLAESEVMVLPKVPMLPSATWNLVSSCAPGEERLHPCNLCSYTVAQPQPCP